MNHATQCPVDQLHAFVNDELHDSLHDGLVKHLDQCEPCRQRLIQAAGSADDWAVACEALAVETPELTGVTDPPETLGKDQPRETPADVNALLQLLAPSDDPRAAGRIGPFEIIGIVGSGGMGIVLKARDPALDRYVAIKLLAPHLASSPSARQRFAREARAAAAVIHDNVIAIYQVAHWNDLPYLVMPYLPDPSLQQRIDSTGGLDLESTLSVGLQIAKGLAAAHTQGLVHRDVKPANVLLCKGTERAVITDFGLARASDDASLTRAGMLTGTPHYMSPEQARGESVDQRSDLFSLGSVLFAMIAGRPPIDSDLGSETIQQIATSKLPSLQSIEPTAPDWLTKLITWLHRPHPADRPNSAGKVAELLEQCLAHRRQPAKTPLPECLLPSQHWSKKNSLLATTIMAGILALIAVAFYVSQPAGLSNLPAPDAVETSTITGSEKAISFDPDLRWSEIDSAMSALVTEADRLEFELKHIWKNQPRIEIELNEQEKNK